MKHFKENMGIGLMLLICTCIMFVTQPVHASEAVRDADGMYTVQPNGEELTLPFSKDKNTQEVIKFTITEPSKVKVNCSGSSLGPTNSVTYLDVAVYKDSAFTKTAFTGTSKNLGVEAPVEFTLSLEPGTYYVKYNRDSMYSMHGDGTITTKVTIETTSQTHPITKDKAIIIAPGVTYNDVITDSEEKYYYILDLTKNANVTFLTNMEYANDKYASYTISALDTNGVCKQQVKVKNVGYAVESSMYLEKGVYTIEYNVAGTNILPSYCLGNASFKTTVDYVKQLPTKPKSLKVVTNSKNTVVTGVTDAKVKVYVKAGSKTYNKKSLANGKFTITIPKQKSGVTLKVYAKNSDGKSSTASIKTKVQIPNKPTVTGAKSKSKLIKGKTSAKATVYVKVGSKTYKTTANSKGQYSVKVPALKKGTSISVYAKNAGGSSATVKTKVK